MMGHHARSEALFYYFRLEDQVPETHLLRLIDQHVSFDFVRQQLKQSYSETGRPSIDPVLLLRMLLISRRKVLAESTGPRLGRHVQAGSLNGSLLMTYSVKQKDRHAFGPTHFQTFEALTQEPAAHPGNKFFILPRHHQEGPICG